MKTDNFYPEMKQSPAKGTDLIIERLYKRHKVTCLNDIELNVNRSIEFKRKNDEGNNVYYVTDAALKKLSELYNVSYSQLLD